MDHSLEVGEPAALNHESFDLLRLLLLVAGGCVETKCVKSLPLQSQVNRIGANLLVKGELLPPVRV